MSCQPRRDCVNTCLLYLFSNVFWGSSLYNSHETFWLKVAFFAFGVLLSHAVSIFAGSLIAFQHRFHQQTMLFPRVYFMIMSLILFSLGCSMAFAASSQRRPHSNGRSQLTLFPRQFQGASESFYLIFAYPLHKHLVVNIILFLADEDAEFTCDICRLCCSSSFMWTQCMTFRCVDTPSVASLDDSSR